MADRDERQPRDAAREEPAVGARYTRVAMILHWTIAALILFNLSVGFFMEGWPAPFRFLVILMHISAGMTVLALTVVRVIWRILHQPPPYPTEMRPWERNTAHFVHLLLYAAMVLMPLTGWAIISANPPPGSPGAAYRAQQRQAEMAAPRPAGQAPPAAPAAPNRLPSVWGVIPLPMIAPLARLGEQPEGVPSQRRLHEDFVHYHGLGGFLLIGLLLLHVAGALKHQFIDRQPELQRMGLGRRRLLRTD